MATYAIDHEVMDFNPHKVALFDRVAIVSVLACFEGGGPSWSPLRVSMSSAAAEDGEVKIA